MQIGQLNKGTGVSTMPPHVHKAKELEYAVRRKARMVDLGDENASGASSYDDSLDDEFEDDEEDDDDEDPIKNLTRQSHATSQRHASSARSVVASESSARRQTDNEQCSEPRSSWSKSVTARRARFDPAKALSAVLDPAARAERATASLEQRTSAALALTQIQDLQGTVRQRDMKIEHLEHELRNAERTNHALERKVTALEMELKFSQMLSSRTHVSSSPTVMTSFTSDASIVPGNGYNQSVSPLRHFNDASNIEPLPSQPSSSSTSQPSSVEYMLTLTPSKRNAKNKSISDL